MPTVVVPPDMNALTFDNLDKPERAIQWARYECDVKHVHEQGGNNRGADVEKYLKAAGVPVGSAWCVSFVFWCLLQSGFDKLKLCQHPASVYCWIAWAKTRMRTSKIPKRGRMFTIFGDGHSHGGFVVRPLPLRLYQTIEGNTNEGGSREGDRVMRRIRRITPQTLFLDLGGL